MRRPGLFVAIAAASSAIRVLLLKHVRPRTPCLALPSTTALNIPERTRVLVAWVGTALKLEAVCDFETNMASEVADVPQRIRLGLEERDDDGAVG